MLSVYLFDEKNFKEWILINMRTHIFGFIKDISNFSDKNFNS